MAKKIQLSIAEPCHENWDAMTNVEKGKFCDSCQKQVIDFSNMSDRQVAEFFKKPTTDSVCGRFMADQLDRSIDIPKKRIPWVKYFFQFALPAFLLSLKSSSAKAQGEIKIATKDTAKKEGVFSDDRIMLGMISQPINDKPINRKTNFNVIKVIDTIPAEKKMKDCSPEIMCKISDPVQLNQNEIAGIVVDDNGEPVSLATITYSKTGEVKIAREDGSFIVDKSWLGKENTIIISSAGFKSLSLHKGEDKYLYGKLFVQLEKANLELKEVVITSDGIYRKGMVTGAYSVIRYSRLLPETNNPVTTHAFLVYPNPVPSGKSINLSFKNLDEDYYKFQLINVSGQSIHQQEIWIDVEARLLNIDIPMVAAGNYFVVLINKKTGKKFTEKIIVQ